MRLEHRFLWSTRFVRKQLGANKLSDGAIFGYFLAIMAFDWLQFTLIATTPSASINQRSYVDSWTTFVITVLGLVYLFYKNGGSGGKEFLSRYFPLSVTVGWKFAVAMFLAMYLLSAGFAGQNDEVIGWFSAAIVAVLNIIMFWRIGHHLGVLASAADGLNVGSRNEALDGAKRLQSTAMSIRIATTDSEIIACYPVMRELRAPMEETEFLARVRRQEKGGYRLAFLQQPEGVVAVAGFRVGENLAWGRFLYIDDLVTLSTHRSKGLGASLLSWLREIAVKRGCVQMHLDSGVQRKEAHRFYERTGMSMASLHFVENLSNQ